MRISSMPPRSRWIALAILTVAILSTLPVAAQFDPGERPVRIFAIVDAFRDRLATIVVPNEPDRAYQADREYWRFGESSLASLAEEELLRIEVLAEGDWDDPEILEALAWRPDGEAVEWNHPATVEWTPQSTEPAPEAPNAIYFENSTLGGLAVSYSATGSSSLLWIKLTEGPYMQLDDGAEFRRESKLSRDGAWWRGSLAE